MVIVILFLVLTITIVTSFFILWKLFGKSCMCRESTSAFIKIEIHSSHFMDVGVTRVFINTDGKLAMRHEEWSKGFGLRYWVNKGDIFKDGEDWEFLGIKTKNSVSDLFGLKCLLRYLFLSLYIWLCWVLVAAHGIFTAVHGLSSCGTWAPACMGSEVAVYRVSCSMICGILVPQPGIEPKSPELQGRFLTTWWSGKSWLVMLFFPAINLRIVSLNDLLL